MHNIPVVSWLWLRGKCAACGVRIPGRYPLVEALTGVLFAAVAWKLGFGWPAFAGLVLTAFLIALAFIDIDTQFLPDRLTLPLMWIGLLLAWWGRAPQGGPIPAELHFAVGKTDGAGRVTVTQLAASQTGSIQVESADFGTQIIMSDVWRGQQPGADWPGTIRLQPVGRVG